MTVVDVPELVAAIISYVDGTKDLLRCAQVNKLWSNHALQRLYEGSLIDMRFRSPDIGSLNSLFIASRERFAQNMGFVKHLTLCSDYTISNPFFMSNDGNSSQWGRHNCRERFRPFSREADLHYFISNSKMLRSVSIPFEILHQEICNALACLGGKGVKSLTLDSSYFEHIESRDADCFRLLNNLEALTLHVSNEEHSSGIEMIQLCNLKVFHIQCQDSSIRGDSDDFEAIIQLLTNNQELEALALRYAHGGRLLDHVYLHEDGESPCLPWPNLRAVYFLSTSDAQFLQFAPQYKHLQIISIHANDYPYGAWPDNWVRLEHSNFTRCKQLRVLELASGTLPPLSTTINIAQSCPHLQRLTVVRLGDLKPELHARPPHNNAIKSQDFFQLLQALPNAEVIELGYAYVETVVSFFAFTKYNPRLKYFRFPHANFVITLDTLERTAIIAPCLELLQVNRILFSDAQTIMKREKTLQKVKTEWYRIFPSMRQLPCQLDPFQQTPYSAIPPYSRSTNTDHNSNPISAEHRRLEIANRNVFRYIWTKMGYVWIRSAIESSIYFWQKAKDVEIFGWPIVPWQAYTFREEYSSLDLGRRSDETRSSGAGVFLYPPASAWETYP